MISDRPAAYDLGKDFSALWKRGISGGGVRVAVLDTGAGPTAYEEARKIAESASKSPPHQDFWDATSKEIPHITHVTLPMGQLERVWQLDKGRTSAENLEHGTAVVHRILMVSEAATILDTRVFTPDCTDAELVGALEQAVHLRADIINL